MLGGLSRFLRRYAAPLGYLTGLFAMSVVLSYGLSPARQHSLIAWASTNLDHLPTNPIGTLAVSAFITEDSVVAWLILGAVALFPLTRRFGNLRTILLTAGAHVVGSLLSQGLTAWRLSIGAVPESVRGDIDVGPSYVIAAALVAVILYGPGRWSRALAFAGWIVLVPTLFEGFTSLEVSGVGHVVSMITAALIGAVFVARETLRGRHRPAVETPAPVVRQESPEPVPG